MATSATALFDTLAKDVGTASGKAVTSWLEDQGVADPIAEMVGNAVASPGAPATLPAGSTVTLPDAIGKFLPAGASLPSAWADTTITALSILVSATGPAFAFSGSATVPLHLAAATADLDVDLSLANAPADDGRTTTGSLEGTTAIGDQDVEITVDLSGSASNASGAITVTWSGSDGHTISFEDLCTAFGVTAPDPIDDLPSLDLTSLKFDLDAGGATGDHVEVEATWAHGDVAVAFGTPTAPDQWVGVLMAVFGGGLDELGSLGNGLSNSGFAASADLTLLASTGTWTGLSVPALATTATAADADAGTDAFTIDVTAGFMFRGELALSNTDGSIAGNIGSLVPTNGSGNGKKAESVDIVFVADLSTEKESVSASLDAVNLLGFPLVAVTVTATMESDQLSFTLDGAMTVNLSNDANSTAAPLVLDLGLDVTETQLTGYLDISDTSGIPVPDQDGMPNVIIDNLGIMVGLDFVNEEVVVGLEAVFELGDENPSGSPTTSTLSAMMPAGGAVPRPPVPQPNEVAIVAGVNVETGVVDADLLLLSVPTLDLTDVVAKLLGTDTSTMDDVLGDIQVRELLLYWCDAPGGLVLPDGSSWADGFQFRGALDMWVDSTTDDPAFAAFGALDVLDTGFTGSAIMSPIAIGKLDGGDWSLHVTGHGDVQPGSDADKAGITSGGPAMSVSTVSSPWLSLTADVSVCEVANADVAITVAKDEFTFDLDVDVDLTDIGIGASLGCTVTDGWRHLEAGFTVGVNGSIDIPDIGSMRLDVDCDVMLTVDAADTTGPDGFAISLAGSFTFGSQDLTIPTLTLDVSFAGLASLPDELLKWIEQEAETIFADGLSIAREFIAEYGDDALKEFEKVAKTFADDVRDFARWALGMHKSKASEALVTDGTEYDVVRESLLRWVPDLPDVTTLDALTAQLGPATDIGALMLNSTPRDTVQMPSRVNGTILLRRDDQAVFLVLDDLDDSGNPFSATYKVDDVDAFRTAQSTLPNNMAWQQPPKDQDGATGQSSGDDIDKIPTNKSLRTHCSIQEQGQGAIHAFCDGVRYYIPPDLWQDDWLLTGDYYPKYAQMSSHVFDVLPIGEDLPSLADGDLVRTADGTTYQVEGRKLHALPDGYDTDKPVTTTSAPLASIMRIGDPHHHEDS